MRDEGTRKLLEAFPRNEKRGRGISPEQRSTCIKDRPTWYLRILLLFTLPVLLGAGRCDDPIPGPIGSLILVIHTTPASADSRFAYIQKIQVDYHRIDVVHKMSPTSEDEAYTIESNSGSIELNNLEEDVVVGQYQVPVGFVTQVRIFATRVVVYLKDGSSQELPVGSSHLPSWKQTGWKIASEQGTTFPIEWDEMTGMLASMDFNNRLVRLPEQHSPVWKIKPTLDAEYFAVNPIDNEPGVFLDQLIVFFNADVNRQRVNEINAAIGASVIRWPVCSRAVRTKLPATIKLQEAVEYYRPLPEVSGIMPYSNAELYIEPDMVRGNHELANLEPAWEYLSHLGNGIVGTSRVKVAIIDNGINWAHPDIFMNLAINQGELPPSRFDRDGDGVVDQTDIDHWDIDGDGVFSFWDLNHPDFWLIEDSWKVLPHPSQPSPPPLYGPWDIMSAQIGDYNGGWLDGIDNDGICFPTFEGEEFCPIDDLLGYDFAQFNTVTLQYAHDNNPRHSDVYYPPEGRAYWREYHGTAMAQILGAVGDNGIGNSGTSWRVSIIPIKAGWSHPARGTSIDKAASIDAINYAEALGVDIVIMSFGNTYCSENAGSIGDCVAKKIPQAMFDALVDEHSNKYGTAYFAYNSAESPALYMIAAGNEGANIAQNNVYQWPAEMYRAIVPDRTLIVGGAKNSSSRIGESSFGPGVVELWAPGRWFLTEPSATKSDPDKEYWYYPDEGERYGAVVAGTSVAAPTAAGVAVLTMTAHPHLQGSPEELKRYLIDRADQTIDAGAEYQPLVNAYECVR